MKPHRMLLANLPTKIEPLREHPFEQNLFIKRDDQTGSEFQGNKIRKLEFAVQEAIEQGCNTLITCGGIQSNHARATAAVAAKLGMKCHLFLRSDQRLHPQGNYLLDELLGAKIHLITAEEYQEKRKDLMRALKDDLGQQGNRAYLIPEGASNEIGTFGYFHAFEEILTQEEEMGTGFDTIVCAVGSAGTYAGLVFANAHYHSNKQVIGVNICNDADYFKQVTLNLVDGFEKYLGERIDLAPDSLTILDGYVGRGYALNTPEEMDFVRDFARQQGIILDPVYTGKAMRGLWNALSENHPLVKDSRNILFIHTGGLFGLFPKAEEFSF